MSAETENAASTSPSATGSMPPTKRPIDEVEDTNARTDDAGDEMGNRGANPRLRMSFLPKYCGKKDIERVLRDCSVDKYASIKKAPKWDYCFVAFHDEATRDKAVELLQGKTMKEKPFEARAFEQQAAPEFFRNRTARFGNESLSASNDQPQEGKSDAEPIDPYKKLASQVTPLWDKEYDEQLVLKRTKLRKSIVKFGNQLLRYLPREYGSRHHQWATFTEEEIRESTKLEPEERAIRQLSWLGEALRENGGAPCDVQTTVPSPVIDGYRNKCEFSFGISPKGEKTVGFMLGLFREGIVSVLDPSQCKHVSPATQKLVSAMQQYLDKSDLEVYDRVEGKGFWRLFVTRTMNSGENMIMLQVKALPEAEKEKQDRALEELKEIFTNSELNVTTMLVQYHDGRNNGIAETPTECIFGTGYVKERLLDLDFRVGPLSFFQVNTKAAEVLYSKVREMCELEQVLKEREEQGFRKIDTMPAYFPKPIAKVDDASAEKTVADGESSIESTEATSEEKPAVNDKDVEKPRMVIGNRRDKSKPGTVVLDLCCGTGTIGLTMAGHVKKVIGVDIVESAVRDAMYNASLNGIDATLLTEKRTGSDDSETDVTKEVTESSTGVHERKVTYIADKAENAIRKILRDEVGPQDDVVAVLDPPRNGCHADVIRAIRDCSGVDRVVFVSCDSDQAMQNFVDLCRPTSNKFKGLPFVPRTALPVDLFPHTKLCELLVSFRRLGGRRL